jgi:hypothetical protein
MLSSVPIAHGGIARLPVSETSTWAMLGWGKPVRSRQVEGATFKGESGTENSTAHSRDRRIIEIDNSTSDIVRY